MLNYVPCQNMFKYLVSVNVILFENKIFIDAINLRCGHNGLGFPGGSDGKESAHNAGDLGLISGSGRFPGEGNGNALQYSCLENSMDRGAWRATVHGVPSVRHDLATKQSFFHISLRRKNAAN